MRDILLLETNGRQYGIWKDEILSVRETGALHRLPLSPACIAGVTLIDGSTVTLADLPVCIGLAPAGENGKRRVLLLSSGDKATGFMVSGDMESLSVPSEEVIPMPEYLKTDLIASCIVRGDVLVPIINLSVLYQQLLKTNQEPYRASFIPAREPEKTAADVRLFRIGNEVFGALSRGGEEKFSAPADRITELSLVPQFVRGITLHRGRALPVIDLCQRIRRRKTGNEGRLMIHEAGSDSFGLLVDELRGSLAFPETVLADLPAIARIPWLRSAMLLDGTIIPLVDIETLLIVNTEAPVDTPLPKRYSLNSQFHSLFNMQPADVVEFSLLGARHALPKSEVEDVISCTSFRSIPETPEIVIGVKEHNGALLPVLDLAMVFGRRSLFTSEWKMILIKNGDFRAFVITESVFRERSLPLEVQRDLPIVLPHRVVYGCYPDADAVRLILNVGAIALHFEKSLVTELLPALSPEMKLAPAEFVASLLGEEAAAALAAEAAVGSGQEQLPTATETGSSQEISETSLSAAPMTSAEMKQETEQQAQHMPEAETGQGTTTDPAAEAGQASDEAVSALAQPEAAPLAMEPVQADTVSAQAGKVSPVTEITAPAAEERAEEEILKPEEMQKPEEVLQEQVILVPVETIGEVDEQEKIEEAAVEQEQDEFAQSTSTVSPAGSQPEPERTQPKEPMLEPEAVSKPLSQAVPEPEPAQEHQTEPQDALVQGSETEHRPQYQSPWRSEQEQGTSAHAAFTQPCQEPKPVRSRLSPEISTEQRDPSWQRRLGYAGIAAMIAVIVLLLLRFETVKNGKPGEAIGEKIEQATMGSAKVQVEPVKPKQVSVEPKVPASNIEPPLELEIPRERPVAIDVYVVVKDDTLWSISQRFTGNPFNYPRIAGENRIADPDLIFPGQRIRLKKKL